MNVKKNILRVLLWLKVQVLCKFEKIGLVTVFAIASGPNNGNAKTTASYRQTFSKPDFYGSCDLKTKNFVENQT